MNRLLDAIADWITGPGVPVLSGIVGGAIVAVVYAMMGGCP